ncbi:unnamed protein product [Owenia fusiformis]|uniref:Uncharacterized protein n=1 Tax=Owenia fusiformis TaxID=6347 RepID=A0A8S4N578_OWEFU|nr:unnamed protein product [Owenia fusiformis]
MIGVTKLCLVALTTVLIFTEINGSLEIIQDCPEGGTKGSFSYSLTNNLNREIRVVIHENVNNIENKQVLLNSTKEITMEARATVTGKTTNFENPGPGMLTFYYRVSVSGDIQYVGHSPCVLKPTDQPRDGGSLIQGSLLLLLVSLLTFMIS